MPSALFILSPLSVILYALCSQPCAHVAQSLQVLAGRPIPGLPWPGHPVTLALCSKPLVGSTAVPCPFAYLVCGYPRLLLAISLKLCSRQCPRFLSPFFPSRLAHGMLREPPSHWAMSSADLAVSQSQPGRRSLRLQCPGQRHR